VPPTMSPRNTSSGGRALTLIRVPPLPVRRVTMAGTPQVLTLLKLQSEHSFPEPAGNPTRKFLSQPSHATGPGTGAEEFYPANVRRAG